MWPPLMICWRWPGAPIRRETCERRSRFTSGFSRPIPAKLMLITPYDKGALKAIEKAIQNSDLGVNPNNDGSVIRLNFPPLTEERRRALVKVAHGKAEDGRIALRNVRRGARKDLEAPA